MSEDHGGERVIAGRYRLLSPLGEGGMGTVWRARDELLHREVAVKEVRAPAGLPTSDVERMYARLEREAWAAARVADRNVVTVYDVATQDGGPVRPAGDGETFEPGRPAGSDVPVDEDLVLHGSTVRSDVVSGPHMMM